MKCSGHIAIQMGIGHILSKKTGEVSAGMNVNFQWSRRDIEADT